LTHAVLTVLPLPVAVVAHFLLNCLGESPADIAMRVWEDFNRKVARPDERHPEFHASPPLLDAMYLQRVKVTMCGVVCDGAHISDIALLQKPAYPSVLIVDDPTVRKFTKVGNTIANTLLAYAARNMNKPDLLANFDAWKGARVRFQQFLRPVKGLTIRPFSTEEVLAHLKDRVTPLRYRQYVQAADDLADGINHRKTETFMVKADETLPERVSPADCEGTYLKPRTIIVVPPRNHLEFMTYSLAFKAQIVPEINKIEFVQKDATITITLAYGFKVSDLDAWWAKSELLDGYHAIILCDDIFVMFARDGRAVCCLAADMAQFDASNGEFAQRARMGVYEVFGMPLQVRADYLQCCHGKRVLKTHVDRAEVVLEWNSFWSTPTGHADTSLGGSFANAHGFLLALYSYSLDDFESFPRNFVSTYALLGFKAEVEGGDGWLQPELGTFLRGRWIRGRWVPLSAIKLLRTKVDPAELFPRKQNPLAWYLGGLSTATAFRRDPFWDSVLGAFERYASLHKVDFVKARERVMTLTRGRDENPMWDAVEPSTVSAEEMVLNLTALAATRGLPFDACAWLVDRAAFEEVREFPIDTTMGSLLFYARVTYGVEW
jgi:hypothetical protein